MQPMVLLAGLVRSMDSISLRPIARERRAFLSAAAEQSVRTATCILFSLLLPATSLFALEPLGDYTSHQQAGHSIRIWADTSSVRLTCYPDGIVHVQYYTSPSSEQPTLPVVVQDSTASVPYTLLEDDSLFTLYGPRLTVEVQKYPVRLAWYSSQGLLTREPDNFGLSWQGEERAARFEVAYDEQFYGTGERGIGPELSGYRFHTWNQAFFYGGPAETMKINVPLVLSSRGYAIYFDNSWPAWFDIKQSSATTMSYRCEGGELSYYLMAADGFPELLEKYTWLTGRPPLPPKWALGYLQSKYGYRNEQAARNLVQQFRNRDIPLDAIILDLYWFDQMGDLDWNLSAFPNPAGMITDFMDEGVKTILITEPYFTEHSNHAGFFLTNPMFVGQNASGDPYRLQGWWSCGCDAFLFDITHPAGQVWFRDRYINLLQDGVSGFWTDLGEPERHPGDMVHHGGSAAEVHNLFNFHWASSVEAAFAQERPGERLFNLTRSGYAGQQRLGTFTWSGDVERSWGGLDVQVPIMLNMGLSGFPYHSSDLGGFGGNADTELYIRWLQFGAFTPAMRAHGVDNEPTEPWGFGSNAEAIVRDFIRLRYRLLPYIYTLARQAHNTGIPIARPLFFHAPDNPSLTDRDDAFLFGPDLLVAPITQPNQRSKTVALPPGEWIDFWTDETYAGSQTVTVPAPLERIPVFVRAGAILPMQPPMAYVNEIPLDSMILQLYPSSLQPSGTWWYDDDGLSQDYLSGEYGIRRAEQAWEDVGGMMVYRLTFDDTDGSFDGSTALRKILAQVHRIATPPSEVQVDGSPLNETASFEELQAAEEGWYHDPETSLLSIFFEPVEGAVTVVEAIDAGMHSNEPDPARPQVFTLEPNYPNPFNSSTRLSYSLPSAGIVRVTVYDLLGREVTTLLRVAQPAGRHLITWDGLDQHGTAVSSGVYIVQLQAGDRRTSRRVLLVR